jgi:hypothetical protein
LEGPEAAERPDPLCRRPATSEQRSGAKGRYRSPNRQGLSLGKRLSELRRPLGIAIVGGLLFSQALTLYTTPVVYLYLDRFQLWWSRVRGARRAHATATPSEA